MTRVAIIGGGLGGLAVALFAARRGHDVVLLERDERPASETSDDRAGPRYRRGVPQAVHSHTFLARAATVLRAEAPDVLTRLTGCSHRLDFTRRFAGGELEPMEGDEDLWAIACRRRTFESTMLAAVLADPHVTIMWAHRATTLLASGADALVPRVVGVRTSEGVDIRADVVVDASGARTTAPTLLERAVGVRPVTSARDSGFTYFTRWYRLRDGARFPAQRRLPYADGHFATVATFPADGGHFSLTYMAPTAEPLRAALREPSVLEAVLSRFSLTEEWLDPALAEPSSDVLTMAGGKERHLDLTANGRPIVCGFVCVADAALSTNPTRGRGTSMAFVHASALADLLPLAEESPLDFADAFGARTARDLRPWFESTVDFDRSRVRRLEAGLRRPFPDGVDPFELAVCSFSAYAEKDPVLYRALVRIVNMLAPSDEVMRTPDVRAHLASAVERWGAQARLEGPNRSEFEEICGRRRSSRQHRRTT